MKKNNKEFIKEEDGTVRYCEENISKMTPWEYIKAYWKQEISEELEWIKFVFWELVEGIVLAFLVILVVIFYPLMMYVRARADIKRAKEEEQKAGKLR